MVDVIVYKLINPRPTGSCLYMINPLGYALGFIIYHIKNERVYVSYNNLTHFDGKLKVFEKLRE